MANGATIGSLRVDLGLNSAQFTKGLQNASKGLNKWGVQVTLSLETVAYQFGRLIGAMPRAIKGAIDHADALSKSAQKAGTTTEALSRLAYAAGFSDVSLEQLTGGLGKLSKAMADATMNKTSAAATAFKALGISVTDASGRLRPADKVFAEISDRFSRMENGATKTSLAMMVFGKSGADMIPLLNEGAASLQRYADEADRLGITISTETGRAAERFNDTLGVVGKVLEGVVNKMAEAALPALQSFAKMLASPEFARAAQSLATTVITALDKITKAIVGVINMLTDLAGKITNAYAAATAPTSGRSTSKLRSDLQWHQNKLANPNISESDRAYNERMIREIEASLMLRNPLDISPTGPGGRGRRTKTPTATTSGSTSDDSWLDPLFSDKSAAAAAAKAMAADIKMMNADLASQKEAWEELQRPIRDTVDAVGQSLSGAMSGLISDLIKGKDAVGGLMDAFGQLGDRLIQMALDTAIQGFLGSLVGGLFGGGGLGVGKGLTGAATYGFTGKGFYGIPSFDGGGFTWDGPRSGGLDGKGGRLAMLHSNESVIDHSAGQGGGGDMIFNITGSRQDATEIARVARQEAMAVYQQMQRNPYRR